MASLTERMMGAARLDAATYNEVEADQSATPQAMLVVVISSIAAGIGVGGGGVMALVLGSVVALVAWGAWAFVIYLIGTKLLAEPQTEADWGQLLRTLGFAATPGILRVLGLLPGVGTLLVFAVSIWMLAATVIAVREALDYESTGRAIAVCVIGFVAYLVIATALAVILGVAGLGMAAAAG